MILCWVDLFLISRLFNVLLVVVGLLFFRRFFGGSFLLGAWVCTRFDPFFQVRQHGKLDSLFGRNHQALAGAWIAALARFGFVGLKGSKSCNLDVLFLRQGLHK